MKNRGRSARTLCLPALLISISLLGIACKPRAQVRTSPLNPAASQPVAFTVNASDSDGVAQIKIWVNDALVTTCNNTDTCTYTGGPYAAQDQGLVTYRATAKDTKGYVKQVGPYQFAVGRPWNNQTWVPVRTSSLSSSQAIDVCFGFEPGSGYNNNLHTFLADVEDKIFDRYMQTNGIKGNERKYKFYYTATPMDASNCGANLTNIPTFLAGSHCNAFAVLHNDNMRDCSIGNVFTAEGYTTQAFIHESGHAIFGLSDEYEGDTSYHLASPFPNIWPDLLPSPSTGKLSCETDVASYGGDVTQCNEFCNDPSDCGFGWWRYSTDTVVMKRGFHTDKWGLPASKQVSWIHAQY